MKPGDIVFSEDPVFGKHTFYKIEAVFIGAEGQESVVKLRSLSLAPASMSDDDRNMKYMFVPEPLVRGKVFTQAKQ